MISIDDLNDWVGFLNPYQGKVYTPNLYRLASSGLVFNNAHSPSPMCNPSRTAILLELMPSTTGVYENDEWWLPNLPDVKSLPKILNENGYFTAGSGKVFHHTAGFNPPDQWDDFQEQVFDDPWAQTNYYPTFSKTKPRWLPANKLEGAINRNSFDWRGFESSDYEMDDGKAAL